MSDCQIQNDQLPLPVLPANPCVRYVSSFEELLETRFAGEVNALCWPRQLPGDYGEIVRQLAVGEGIHSITDEILTALPLSGEGQLARAQVLTDLEALRERGLLPVLDCINGYINHEQEGPVATHVQSFHVDSATAEADTYLCTYYGLSSEGISNDQVRRHIDMEETRAELRKFYEKIYDDPDDEGFLEFLSDHFYDLHYKPLPGAKPWSFGIGNLWRIACDYPGSPVLPCVHRAPETMSGTPPRLLLIS